MAIAHLFGTSMLEISRTTIKDVAQKTGVLPQTRSRVINERPGVACYRVRESVTVIVQELGFRLSALARD